MAVSQLVYQLETTNTWFLTATILSIACGLISLYSHSQFKVPADAPKLASKLWPIVGNFKFFSARWDFHRTEAEKNSTGNWSYYVADKPVVGLSGDTGRKLFFNSGKLNMDAGYKGLFAGSPDAPSTGEKSLTEAEHSGPNYFTKRIIQVLRRERLAKLFPTMIKDLQQGLDRLAAQKVRITDPFDSIYDFLYIMIVRVVACNELATDHDKRKKLLAHYEMIEKAGTPWVIMFPWFPTWAAIKRFWGGVYVYTTFDKIMKDRRKSGRREDDPLQLLMDDGDNTTQIITFIIGALYTGQLNSGINASWIITFLAANPQWHKACWQEVNRAIDKHVPVNRDMTGNPSLSLSERLASLPFEAWEEEFPIVDACLRETIRVALPGSAFRRNMTGQPIRINSTEVIPPGFYASYAVADVHYDASIYPDPMTWNPGRFVNIQDGTPAENYQGSNDPNAKRNWQYLGWGAGRHPCMGMKFAKLEMNLVVAFWMAYFDFEVLEPRGGRLPDIDPNLYSTERPKEKVQIRYWPRGEEKPTASV